MSLLFQVTPSVLLVEREEKGRSPFFHSLRIPDEIAALSGTGGRTTLEPGQ